MTVANVKLGGREYVLIPKRDFARICRGDSNYRKLQEEDRALGKLASARLRAFRRTGSKGIPLEQVKRELGI